MDDLTREALYELVWSEPMLKVAARYEVSSSYMARVCSALNVPRPERGYWAKLAVGKVGEKPALPEALRGDQLAWSPGEVLNPPRRTQPAPAARHRRSAPTVPPDVHPLILGARALFEAGRTSRDINYLKPNKRLVVDLLASKEALTKVLSFANELFLALELNGHRVLIAPPSERCRRQEVDVRQDVKEGHAPWGLWSPQRCTVVYIGEVAIGLTIMEMTEHVAVRYVGGKFIRESDYTPPKRGRYATDYTWTSTKDLPTGRLRLQAYSASCSATWVKTWEEANAKSLTELIPKIVKELEGSTAHITRLVAAGEREDELERQRWDEQQARWEKEEQERRAAEALKESKEELLEAIAAWAESRRIEEFFERASLEAESLAKSDRDRLLQRIELARSLVDSTHPLERLASWKAPGER